MRRLSILLVLALLLPLPLSAGELADVSMSDTVEMGDSTLMLNGMGLRTKLWVKVYVAGLYLPTKSSDAKAILAADETRHLEMHFLYDVNSKKLCEAWEDGLEGNTPNAGSALTKAFDELCGMMQDMEKGQKMSVTYVPGEGTTVEVGGTAKGTIEGKDFADALFACWLGPKPPSDDLKNGLLGS